MTLTLTCMLLLGQSRRLADDPWLRSVEAALPSLFLESVQEPQSFTLDGGRAVVVPGPMRSLVLESEVELQPDTVLEVRLRDAGRMAGGVSLLLSTHAGQASGFWAGDENSFRPLAEAARSLPVQTPLRLNLEARGVELSASIDGELLVHARDEGFGAGKLVLMAPVGSARLAQIVLEPISPEPPVPSGLLRAWFGAWPLLALALVLSCLLAVLTGQGLLWSWTAASFVLLPLAVVAWVDPLHGPLERLPFVLACAGSGLLALLAAAVGGAQRRRLAWVLPLVLLAPPAALAAARGAPVRADLQGGPDLFDQSVAGLHPELAFFQHPLLRQFNPRLQSHRFRDTYFDLQRAQSGHRVMCVGSSSTFGFGISPGTGGDWPAQLQLLLRSSSPDRVLEVLNAGVPGSTASRMLQLWRGDLRRFAPDIVLFCFAYNDCSRLTELDEQAELHNQLQLGSAPGFWEELAGRARLRAGRLAWRKLASAMATGDETASQVWTRMHSGTEAPTAPERFERVLEAWADAVAEAGAELVFVLEPARQPQRVPWLAELHQAMIDVAGRRSLRVVDPQPALDAAGGPALFMDAVHPLAKANRITAALLAPVVEQVLAARSDSADR